MRIQKGTPLGANKKGHSSAKGATFASSISACWNSTATTFNNNNAKNSSPSLQRKTTCLFCPNVVALPPPAISGQNSPNLEKFVVNLCNHLEIDAKQLPEQQFTREKFPFCSSNCEPLIVKLWKQQQILEKMMKNIEKTRNEIEHSVVDWELIGDHGKRPGTAAMANLERVKFTKLRDLVLNGYRNKLFQKQRQNEEIDGVANGYDEGDFGEQLLNDIHNDYEMREDGGEDVETIDIEEHCHVSVKHEQLEDLSIYPVPRSASTSNNGYGQSSQLPQENVEVTYDEQQEEEEEETDEYTSEPPSAEDWSVDPGIVAQYNSDNCTLIITNENDESDETNLIQIKQEAHAPAANEYDFDEPDDSDDIFEMPEKKRRFLFEGVEIYRVSGTGAHSKLDYLQCSLCSYTLNVPKSNNSKVSSPYMKMKTHILHIHKKKSGVPKAPRTRELLCIPCNQTFTNRKELQEHRALHPAEFCLECDICGKPMKDRSSQYNLLIHKFSHKNDEERAISIAKGERGSYNSFLTNKLNMGSPGILTPEAANRKRTRDRRTTRNTEPQLPHSSRSQARSVPKDSGNRKVVRPDGVATATGSTDKPFPCDLCGRRFGRKCHLMRHKMSTHAENLPVSSSSPQSRKKQKKSTNRKTPAPPARQTPAPAARQTPAPAARQTPASAARPTPAPVFKAIANRGTQSFGNLASRGVFQNPQQVSVALPRASLGDMTDRGQRVTAGDGTVVVVKQEVLNLLRNNFV